MTASATRVTCHNSAFIPRQEKNTTIKLGQASAGHATISY